MPIKEVIEKRNLQTPSLTMEAIDVEVVTTSSKIIQHEKLRKARERQGKQEDNLQK